MLGDNRGTKRNQYVADYVVFDLETTGISTVHDAVVEISAIRVQGGKITDEFSTLVNPEMPIPYRASKVNNIYDDMVADAPLFEQALADFDAFIGNRILVGHNIHTFDMNFAYDAAWNFLGRELGNDYVDTLYLARRYLPELSHHKLTDVAEHFQLQTQGTHRALFDCMMNQSCYEEIGRLMEARKKSGNAGREEEITCPSCGGELVLRKGKFGMFYGCSSYPGCRFTRNVRA